MPTNYVLIDYENVQPKNLELLAEHPFKVIVFVGANQAKMPFDFVESMQKLAEIGRGRYIKISGNGKNALDFHVAYYIGELSQQDNKACFHIISKDTGFDPLIKHLKARKIKVQREKDLGEIPELRISSATSNDKKIQAIVKKLSGLGRSKPKKVKTLSNTINSLFTEKLSEDELKKLVQALQSKKYIVINESNVSYNLKSQP